MRMRNLVGLFLTLVPLLPGAARADLVDFSYRWSIHPTAVLTGTNPTRSTGSEQSSGSVAFALALDGNASVVLAGGPLVLPAATLTTTSSAGEDGPDLFASPFHLKLQMTDTAAGAAGEWTFAGTVNGTLTATSSRLSATFDGPLTQPLMLGGRRYEVTIGPASIQIPAPGASARALIDALVQVRSPDTVPPLVEVPAPSSLVLVASAFPLVAIAWRRRWVRRNEPLAM